MTDITLDDLAADQAAEQDDDDGDSAEGVARFLDKWAERLDEKGMLDAFLAKQMDMDATDINTDDGGEQGDELDADAVATFGKLVIDNVGDVPMSKVVKYAESNPQMVNQMIKRATGGE